MQLYHSTLSVILVINKCDGSYVAVDKLHSGLKWPVVNRNTNIHYIVEHNILGMYVEHVCDVLEDVTEYDDNGGMVLRREYIQISGF